MKNEKKCANLYLGDVISVIFSHVFVFKSYLSTKEILSKLLPPKNTISWSLKNPLFEIIIPIILVCSAFKVLERKDSRIFRLYFDHLCKKARTFKILRNLKFKICNIYLFFFTKQKLKN